MTMNILHGDIEKNGEEKLIVDCHRDETRLIEFAGSLPHLKIFQIFTCFAHFLGKIYTSFELCDIYVSLRHSSHQALITPCVKKRTLITPDIDPTGH